LRIVTSQFVGLDNTDIRFGGITESPNRRQTAMRGPPYSGRRLRHVSDQ